MPACRQMLVLATVFAATACSGSKAPVAPTLTPTSGPRIGSTQVTGATDGLASELLLGGMPNPPLAWHPDNAPIDAAETAVALDAMAQDHVRSAALGNRTGPLLLGSTLVRRLAAAPLAVPDGNGNGTNLDEVLHREMARILAFARGTAPHPEAQSVLPWRTRSAQLAEPLPALLQGPLPAGALPPASWRTEDLGDRVVQLDAVGQFLQLRAMASRRLLMERGRGRYGRDAESGSLGLLAMLQVLAAEDTLFGNLFTSGGALGPLADASNYDPQVAPRWLPSEVLVELDPAVPGAALAYQPLDAASDLNGLAAILAASAELLSVTEPAAPLTVPELFRGTPYRAPPQLPIPPSISWSRDIRPLLVLKCRQCHLDDTRGGFSIQTYESMRLGGNKTRFFNLPFLVPGNAAASVLHQVLTGPPAPFVQMPLVGFVTPAQVALIDAWINSGALKDPPAPPQQPQPGHDMARVSYRNLLALHFDQSTGALHHRYEADGGSATATALATGHALQALAAFERVAANGPLSDPYLGLRPSDALLLAANWALAHFLDREGRCADTVLLAGNTANGEADLRAHAAMTAGLFAAADRLLAHTHLRTAAESMAQRLLTAFAAGGTHFSHRAGLAVDYYTAATLTDVLRALRLADRAGVGGAGQRRTALLQQLRPALAFAEWGGHGEVLGDGASDTDHNGLFEPAAAGGAFGRLPLLVDHIVLDATAAPRDGPITWSQHVRPLLLQKCGECHMNGSENGNYRLDTLRSLATPGESLGQFPMLVPGLPDASFFFQKLTSRQPALGSQMPERRTPLDATSLALLRRWIETGASSR